jgi:hypothetical protein
MAIEKNLILKKLLLSAWLMTRPIFAEDSFYENLDRTRTLENITNNFTIRKTQKGQMPINFSTFEKIGFDYPILGDLSRDLTGSKLVFTYSGEKEYYGTDLKRQIDISTVKEERLEGRLRILCIIHLKTDRCHVAVDFNAMPSGSNTSYNAEIYVRPNNFRTRTVLKALTKIPSFDRLVESKISDMMRTSENLFTILRKDPDMIYKTCLPFSDKQRIRRYFD